MIRGEAGSEREEGRGRVGEREEESGGRQDGSKCRSRTGGRISQKE